MRRFFLLITLIPLFSLNSACPQLKQSEFIAAVEKWEPTTSGFIGLFQQESLLYTRSFGFADQDKQTPFTSQTCFVTGSLTKQMTAAALLCALEEQNQAIPQSLHLPIIHYLKEEDPFWQGNIPAWAEVVTLHQLLTHTSGLTDFVLVPELIEKKATILTPHELVQQVIHLPLQFEPGTSWDYSNTGYHLTGIIVERLAYCSLEHFLETRFFQPIGMVDTSLCNAKKRPLAQAYFKDRSTLKDSIAADYPLDWCWASGGITSTAVDLVKWNLWLYQSSFAKEMLQLHVTFGEKKMGNADGYGYGLFFSKQNAHPVFWHGGHLPGLRHILIFLPEDQITLIAARNVIFNPSQAKTSPELSLDFSLPLWDLLP